MMSTCYALHNSSMELPDFASLYILSAYLNPCASICAPAYLLLSSIYLLPWIVLSCLDLGLGLVLCILSCAVLSSVVLSCLVYWFVFGCLVLSCSLVLCCVVLYCLACLVLCYVVLSCPVLCNTFLSCLALPCLVLPCLAKRKKERKRLLRLPF
jgi:hypothetical protein